MIVKHEAGAENAVNKTGLIAVAYETKNVAKAKTIKILLNIFK